MKSYKTYTILQDQVHLTVEQYMKQVLQYSGRSLQKLTRQKGILLNGKSVFLQKKLTSTDTLRILILDDHHYGPQPQQGPLEILYEDDHLMIVNKPAYQLVHPTGQTTTGTLANYLAYELQRRDSITTVRPIHRLDRETSGCVMFAKDSHSQFILEQQLKARTLKRTYWALVKGLVSTQSGIIDASIGAHPSLPNRRAINEHGETAVTHYQVVRTFDDTTLLELTLDTGRTHQIRLHLAHLGHPILGDNMYGVRSPFISRQALHACSIQFQGLAHLQEHTVQAPLPLDFARALDFCAK